MALTINGGSATPITDEVKVGNGARGEVWYHVYITGTCDTVNDEVSINLATYAPNVASCSWATLRAFYQAADATSVTVQSVLGRATNPLAGLDPIVYQMKRLGRGAAGRFDVPLAFRMPTNKTLYLRPLPASSGGQVRIDLHFSPYVVH